ncbi:MAG: TonB-dependent receptor [Gammaproteobacteria bacterium]|nr:TonB-dependent receptor [Gammaproteobacteria bacterium]
MTHSSRSGAADTRQSFSSFPVFVATLASGRAAALGAAPAAAQQASELTVREVVVSDTRFETSNVTVPASIDIISREEIERSGARHVAEVLRGRGGVQVSDQFGDGSRVAVGVRGFGETANANTLILVDGRRLNNSDIANPDLNSISLRDVERIEIIQGSAGTLFGDQAVGGVINIITRRPQRFRAELAGVGGSYGRREATGAISQRLDNGISYRVSGEVKRSNNYRNHNDLELRSVFGSAGFEYATGDVFVELQHVVEELETPGALFPAEVAADRQQAVAALINDFADTETNVARVGIRQSILDWLSFEAEATNREVQADFFLSFRTFPGSLGQQTRHLVGFTPRLVGAYPTRNGDLLFTIGHDLEIFDYNIESIIGTQQNDQKIRGNYAQVVVPVHRKVSVTLGARDARVENDLIDTFIFPAGIEIDDSEFVTEAGLSFRPNEQWRLFARRDENVRFAKVDEFLNPPPGVVLRTQTGVSWETGIEWSNGVHDARVMFYRLDLDNEIAAVPGTGLFGSAANINIPGTRRDGVIVAGGYRAADWLRLAGDYSFIDASVTEGPLEGNRVPFVSKHSLRLAAEVDVNERWRIFAEMQSVSDRVFSGDFDQVLGTRLPGYTVLNLKTDYRHRNWTFEARLNNVLNKEYSDFGARATIFPPPTFAPVNLPSFFPAPERNFWLGARLEFE